MPANENGRAAAELSARDLIHWGSMLQDQLWSLNCNLGLQYMDDAELVAGLRRGDAHAVEYVVRQYAPALYRFAYYQLQDAMLAEDLVSEVMVRMMNTRIGVARLCRQHREFPVCF